MWIPKQLAAAAESAVLELSEAYSDYGGKSGSDGLVAELMAEVIPVLKERIKESSVDKSMDGDEVSTASSRGLVGFAIVATYQFRWFVTQGSCVLWLLRFDGSGSLVVGGARHDKRMAKM